MEEKGCNRIGQLHRDGLLPSIVEATSKGLWGPVLMDLQSM